MKPAKTLSFLVLGIFMISLASAMTTYADWSDGSQTATIGNGESISFNVDFFSMNTPMSMKVELLNAQSEVIYTFLEQTTSDREYSAFYTINNALYGNTGDFSVVVSGQDARQIDSWEITLKVNPSVNPTDTTKPVITLLGTNPQSIVQGTAYTEEGATATDNVDGDITSRIIIDSSAVNTAVIGSYIVTYTVSDTAGNTEIATRTVNVVAQGSNDTTAPSITILSPKDGRTYRTISSFKFRVVDANLATVTYSVSGGVQGASISCTSGQNVTVDIDAEEGENTWSVTATDSFGNTATETITFTINPDYSGGSGGFTIDTGNPEKPKDEENKGTYIPPKTQKTVDYTSIIFYTLISVMSLGIVTVLFFLGKTLLLR